MLDVREILKSLSPEDKIVWEQSRTEMRRTYLNAHNAIVGVAAWDKHDDAFMDLIDIKIAVLFDRAGKIEASKDIISKNDTDDIEKQIVETVQINTTKYLEKVMKNGNNEWATNNGYKE